MSVEQDIKSRLLVLKHTQQSNAKRVQLSFDNDIADHKINKMHKHNLYGHWHCTRPNSSIMHFDITTWPGGLCYTGDMGTYVFERTMDMINFMSRACRSPEYAAEKCVAADRDGITEYDPDLFIAFLNDLIVEAWQTESTAEAETITETVHEVYNEYIDFWACESKAHELIYEKGLCDGGDHPNFKQYTFRFLWCLRAIDWFCRRVGTD